MKKTVLMILGIMMAIALFAGCSSPSGGGPATEDPAASTSNTDATVDQVDQPGGGTKKVGSVVLFYNEWNEAFSAPMFELADEWGWEFSVLDAGNSPNEQINLINSAAAQQFDYLAVQPVGDEAINPAIENAIDAGVSVINLYGKKDEDQLYGKIYQVLFDQKGSGLLQAETFVEMYGETAKVAIISGMAGGDNEELRSAGMREVFAGYPGIEIVQEVSTDWDRQKAMAAAEDIILAHPDIDAFMVQDDSIAWGVHEAIAAAGKVGEIMIASQGFYESSIPAIKEGYFMFTITYPPGNFGRECMMLFKNLADGVAVDSKEIRVVGMDLVTIDNVDTAPF